MGIVVWSALRQLQALRESVAFTLEGNLFQFHTHIYEENEKLNPEEFAQWIDSQGITPVAIVPTDLKTQEQIGEEKVDLLSSMENFLEERYSNSSSWRANYNSSDFGADRSGAGWNRLPNFVITSAFVRLLGASEQFEIDTLKSLLYYRPQGKVELSNEDELITVDPVVVTEEPNDSGSYSKPPIWSWIKKSAENNVERRKIFKCVYGIDISPEAFNGFSKKAINNYYTTLYSRRNAIAHGRAEVVMSLNDYCNAELFIIQTILNVKQQCLDQLFINL